VAHSLPEQVFSFRSRQWVVSDVRPSTVPAVPFKRNFNGPQYLLTLSSVEDDSLGGELQVIWEVEPGAKVIERTARRSLRSRSNRLTGSARTSLFF
jgi:hypothetical protein